MLVFTDYTVKTDGEGMRVRRVGTTICGIGMSRHEGDSEDDYEEITAEEAAELRQQAEAEAAARQETEAQEQARRERDRRIVEKIRERYTLDEELAILRQREEKAEEFAEYYAYVEECKRQVDADGDE